MESLAEHTTSDADERVEALRRCRTFAQVFQYLVDFLGWPLDSAYLEKDDLAALTYDWDPEELGIPAGGLHNLRLLLQMRPLTAKQPWGVFFLELTGMRLPITQVRRLLHALVIKKRAAGNITRREWRLEDLLFFIITGADDSVEMQLVAFRGSDPRTAEIRPLAWRPVQSSNRHLHRLATELLPHLEWPLRETDPETWRAGWRAAFRVPAGQTIRDVTRLAERMAKTAHDLREQIIEALHGEDGSGPFSALKEQIRAQLVSDVSAKGFADMCAQALVYGLLSSRVTDPKGFGSSPIFSTVPLATPFLKAFFEQIHDQASTLDMPGSGLNQLVADLRVTNVEAILDQVGCSAKGGDPVIHFYENFLTQYDRTVRVSAGAFYTPEPAVKFLVRIVDDVLRSRFGLPLGIADATPWREVARREGFAVPEGVDPDSSFVSMVDPATGTGTFLVEWLRRARASFDESGEPGSWSRHLRDCVLPSMFAFELMLAPYAIAHLKAALELHDAGISDGVMTILLTDTLDHAARQGQFDTMSSLVAAEGRRAAVLKESERFTVVIGNPPYNREQHAGGGGKRKGGVVRHGAPGIDPLLKTVTDPMKAAGLGKHLKNVYNDYVYFWRWAVWQATELPAGPGVVAFITASSYLDGVSMGGVREMLRKAFDEIWVVDLGGEGRGARTEENIFDIRTPVAIAVGVRTGVTSTDGTDGCVVRYLRVTGGRADKLTRLSEIGLEDVSEQVAGEAMDSLIPRSDSPYYDWPRVNDLFPWIWSGCQVKRLWPIGETKVLLRQRWRALLEQIPRHRGKLLRETRARNIETKPRALLENGPKLKPLSSLDIGDSPESIEKYGFRSFDRQWIIADNRVVDAAKLHFWRIREPHQVFLTSLTSTKLGHGPALTVTPYVPDLHHFRGSYGAKSVMPLHRDSSGHTPNITDALLPVLSGYLRMDISARDLLAYVYALGGTAAFSERFDEELSEEAGPIHVPITGDPDLFSRAVELGRDLLWWHTWGERFAPGGQTQLPPGKARQIASVNGMPDRFSHNNETLRLSVGTGEFGPVSLEVWNFEVSKLKVLQSWLGYRMKNRKGRKSSPLDYIRPSRWTQTDELLRLLAILEHTVEVTPAAAKLLEDVVASSLISAKSLPMPTESQRKPPKV